jgi:hypothetical protein
LDELPVEWQSAAFTSTDIPAKQLIESIQILAKRLIVLIWAIVDSIHMNSMT